MGSRCVEGAATLCAQDNTRDFGGAVRPNIRQFEDRILRTHFKATLEAWEDSPNYHSYYNWSAICPNCSIDLVWQEYVYWPAPTLEGRRSQPVMEGDRSLVVAAPEGAFGARVPLPGGSVTHYVDAQSKALANATDRVHALYPGYIVRWLSITGSVVVSNTLGRGIGAFARENEFYGVRIFHDLDLRIKERLLRPVGR